MNSILGSGSIFTFRLPITNNSELMDVGTRNETPNNIKETTIPVANSNTTTQNVIVEKKEGLPNLLIVEDNESIITLISAQLENEYNISFKVNGELGVPSRNRRSNLTLL